MDSHYFLACFRAVYQQDTVWLLNRAQAKLKKRLIKTDEINWIKKKKLRLRGVVKVSRPGMISLKFIRGLRDSEVRVKTTVGTTQVL